MEARDLAERFRDVVDVGDEPGSFGVLGADATTATAYEESDFFIDVDGERFLVAVMKVSE